ncbi:MAG: hypothetical protein PUE32_10050, partial [Clostridia bacterium]|nr:hypothetical protein [Clostridia bacterium]
MQEKRTNRHKSIVSLMITLTSIIAALLTFIAVSKSVPGETVTGDYRGIANAVISRGDDMASFSSSLTSISNLDGIDMEKTINTLIAGFRREIISIKAAIVMTNPDEVVQITEADNTHSYILTVEADIFEENVTNPNQLCAYMMNTSATEMYDGREIYSIRELTILPENVNSQRARAIGNVSIKLPSPEQVILLDYRWTSQTAPVTTAATSPVTVPEVRTTASPVTTTATEQTTTQPEVSPTVQPTTQLTAEPMATTTSTPDLPSPGSCE